MVRKISLYLAGAMVRNLREPSAEVEVYAYGLENLIANVTELLILIIMSLVFDIFIPAMLALFAFVILRIPGGGAHLSTFPRCLVSSVASILLLALLAREAPDMGAWNTWLIFVVFLIGLLIILIRVPAGTHKKTITEAALRRQQKYITSSALLIITGAASFLFRDGRVVMAYALLAGSAWAFFIISPLGYWLFEAIDNIMDRTRR